MADGSGRFHVNRLGLLAVRAGLAEEGQVETALDLQQKARAAGRDTEPLGDILVRECGVDRTALETLLAAQQRVGNESVPFRVDLGGESRFGKFRVLRRLGSDADSLTYEAVHEETHHHVILRILRDAEDGEESRRFARDIRKASMLRHPNIIRVFCAGRAHGHDYYATHYEPGESLRRILDTEGRLDRARAAHVGISVARALAHAHERGVHHQRLRPAYVILAPDDRVKVMGLGLVTDAVRDLGHLLRLSGEMPSYIAPEQIGGGEGSEDGADPDQRTDLFSLGAIIFHCLAGEPPFAGENVAEVVESMEAARTAGDLAARLGGCAPEFVAVVEKLLRFDPDERFAAAEEVVDAFASVGAAMSAD